MDYPHYTQSPTRLLSCRSSSGSCQPVPVSEPSRSDATPRISELDQNTHPRCAVLEHTEDLEYLPNYIGCLDETNPRKTKRGHSCHSIRASAFRRFQPPAAIRLHIATPAL